MDMSQKLGANFTLRELCHSDTAVAHGVKNIPTAKEVANLKFLVTTFLQPLRDEIGKPIKVNSGFRNQRTNKLVGSKSTRSAHTAGFAVDIVCPQYGNPKKFTEYVRDFLKRKGIKHDQLILEFYNPRTGRGWCHIGIKNVDGLQRGQIFTMGAGGTRQGIG